VRLVHSVRAGEVPLDSFACGARRYSLGLRAFQRIPDTPDFDPINMYTIQQKVMYKHPALLGDDVHTRRGYLRSYRPWSPPPRSVDPVGGCVDRPMYAERGTRSLRPPPLCCPRLLTNTRIPTTKMMRTIAIVQPLPPTAIQAAVDLRRILRSNRILSVPGTL